MLPATEEGKHSHSLYPSDHAVQFLPDPKYGDQSDPEQRGKTL